MSELGRAWATILYPEHYKSVDEMYDCISSLHVEAYLSPLHDSDEKKSHYHLMICFEGKKSSQQVSELFSSICGVGCEAVNSRRAYARYLCHLDETTKHHYDPSYVMCFGGADYIQYLQGSGDKYDTIGDMISFLAEKPMTFRAFLLYCQATNYTWFRACIDNSYLFRDFCR